MKFLDEMSSKSAERGLLGARADSFTVKTFSATEAPGKLAILFSSLGRYHHRYSLNNICYVIVLLNGYKSITQGKLFSLSTKG